MKVLLVDDDPHVRLLVRLTLDDCAGIEVVGEASDGAEAIEAIRRLEPDAVVMDLHMPGMDGDEATRRVKEFAPHTDVVAFTSASDSWAVTRLIKAGASRGFDKSQLEELVAYLTS